MTTFFMATVHLLRLLSLFTGTSVIQQAGSWTITVPKTVTAVEGSCAVVPCHTEPHFRVMWYKYHNIKYPVVYDGVHPDTVEDHFKGRTSVLGKAAEGNCTLKIDDVGTTENNVKIYVWINPDSKTTQKFYEKTVTIIVERKAPTLTIQQEVVEGATFQINCSVSYSCPFTPPSLHWKRSPSMHNCTLMAFSQRVQEQWLYTETLQGQATSDMHHSKTECSAQFRAFTIESQSVLLNVLYKPLTVTIVPEKEPVTEGDSIMAFCSAKCNPQPHTYSWLKRQMGQVAEVNSTERKMSFSNITRDTSLSCIAHNDMGTGQSGWLDLDVHYAPVILPESSCNWTGTVLQCVCQAQASPNASVHWIIDGNSTLPSSFSFVSTYKKNMVSAEISGPAKSFSNVSCTATNSLGSDSKQLSVYNLLKRPSLPVLLSVLMLLGIALLFGCTVFMYRKYSRNRLPPGSLCNTNIILRSQPEVDRLSCVYDNDLVAEILAARAQQPQNNGTAPRREGEIRPLAKVQ